VYKVGELAENAGHHPDIDIRWNKVKLALTTHDAGGLTDKDFEFGGGDRSGGWSLRAGRSAA
jgi:4a-hydroxytetrahydrobiopterin dehydratase